MGTNKCSVKADAEGLYSVSLSLSAEDNKDTRMHMAAATLPDLYYRALSMLTHTYSTDSMAPQGGQGTHVQCVMYVPLSLFIVDSLPVQAEPTTHHRPTHHRSQCQQVT